MTEDLFYNTLFYNTPVGWRVVGPAVCSVQCVAGDVGTEVSGSVFICSQVSGNGRDVG